MSGAPADPVPHPGGDIFILVAPSGAGKSSLAKALLAQEPDLALSVSCTTRAPRPGEADGREYHFVDRDEFARREARAEFIECAEVHGNRYGTSRLWIERRLHAGGDVLLEIDWQGARQIKGLFPHAAGVFILPPSIEALRHRLRQRGQDPEAVIDRRIDAARAEMTHAHELDFVIVNDDFTTALGQLQAILAAVRLRFPGQARRHAELFGRLGLNPTA
jgi:guanylate kinase